MSKKNFTGGLNSLLGESKEIKTPKVGRPKTQFKEILKTSQKGTKENEIRATFIINEDLLEKLKAIAYWERSLIKDVLDKAIQEAVSKYEKKSGEIKPIPKK